MQELGASTRHQANTRDNKLTRGRESAHQPPLGSRRKPIPRTILATPITERHYIRRLALICFSLISRQVEAIVRTRKKKFYIHVRTLASTTHPYVDLLLSFLCFFFIKGVKHGYPSFKDAAAILRASLQLQYLSVCARTGHLRIFT